MPLTREQLLQLHIKLTTQARELMEIKNQDYGTDSDPFKNFRRHGLRGICVRLGDKLARLEASVEKGILQVKDESVQDTLLDTINYSILFAGLVEDTKTLPAR